VHIGLAALVAVNLVGLNVWAWTEQRALQQKRQALVTLLQTAHPQVRAVIDPARQMARENELLRAGAGQLGDGDLETLLGVAAAAWPEDEAPVESLLFEPGRLSLSVAGWDEPRVAEFRDRVRPAGWNAGLEGERLVLTKAAP
jgi:general secretion pathway protein L